MSLSICVQIYRKMIKGKGKYSNSWVTASSPISTQVKPTTLTAFSGMLGHQVSAKGFIIQTSLLSTDKKKIDNPSITQSRVQNFAV